METQLISGRLSCTRSFVVMHRRNMLKLRRAWTLCTVYKSKAPHAISAANHNKTKEVSSVGSWESSASSNIAYENPHGAELHSAEQNKTYDKGVAVAQMLEIKSFISTNLIQIWTFSDFIIIMWKNWVVL